MNRQDEIHQLQRQLNDIAKQLNALARLDVAPPPSSIVTYSGTPVAGNVAGFTGAGTVGDAGYGTASVVTLTGAQTLTNKTLTSPVMTTPTVSNSAMIFSDPDVDHGMTSIAPTNWWGYFTQSSSVAGGVRIFGFTDDDVTPFQITATVGTDDPTDTLPVMLLAARKKNGTTWQALAAAETALAIDNHSTRLFFLLGNGDTGIAITPAARLHVLQATLGNSVLRLQSTATNDDPIEDTIQQRVATTNNTTTTIATVAIPATTTVMIEARVVARRTGGSAGTAEDGGGGRITSAFKNVAGTATLIGNLEAGFVAPVGWAIAFTPSGGNVLIQVTGATNNNISWHATYRTYPVSS